MPDGQNRNFHYNTGSGRMTGLAQFLPVQLIEITINGEPKTVPAGQSVEALLRHLELQTDRVAVELNRRIVTRRDWTTTPVASGAQLEVVTFVGGG